MAKLNKDAFTHAEVFGDLDRLTMSWTEAASYLEIPFAELMLYSRAGLVNPDAKGGSRFSATYLKGFKKRIRP